jgi:hypothetical protein
MRLRAEGQPTYDATVASRDSAFLWETEVLRSARRPTSSPDPGAAVIADDGEWLTIREASETTGVPPSTIRKWARHDNIPSYLEKTEDGYLRMVSMRGIEHWADEIGRDVETSPGETKEEPAGTTEEVDITEPTDEPAVPEGTMLVPLDAWNKMLNQLGNLHEAGQQLAEARERAAKAETEATFLRERLRELRAEKERQAEPETPPATEPATQEQAPPSTGSLVRRIFSDWRRNRRKKV